MRTVLALAAATLSLSACGNPPAIHADKGYIRLGATPRTPAAAYFTLHGGPTDETLIAVGSEVAIRTEMHESMMAGNMSSMKPLDHVPLPAKGTLEFKPGGKHVMLFDMNPGIIPGKRVTLTFTFADGQRVTYDAKAIAAGDPAPKD